MLSDKEIVEHFGIEKILRKYPPSGQKEVFLTRHNSYGNVILKVVMGQNERVKREIEIVTENQFDNVPKVFEINDFQFGEQSGMYIFEEYIDGDSLKKILENGKLNLRDVMDLTEQILKIIVQMEKVNVVHRDIKPDNIIRNICNDWYLIDFGIARALNMNSLTITEAQIGPHTPLNRRCTRFYSFMS